MDSGHLSSFYQSVSFSRMRPRSETTKIGPWFIAEMAEDEHFCKFLSQIKNPNKMLSLKKDPKNDTTQIKNHANFTLPILSTTKMTTKLLMRLLTAVFCLKRVQKMIQPRLKTRPMPYMLIHGINQKPDFVHLFFSTTVYIWSCLHWMVWCAMADEMVRARLQKS